MQLAKPSGSRPGPVAAPGRPQRHKLPLIAAAACLIAMPAVAQSPPKGTGAAAPPAAANAPAGLAAVGPQGVWYDDTGRGAIEIKACGTSLCGNIYWLQEPLNAKGQPVTDGNNPDAAKRTRPVCGLQVIGNVRPLPNGTWDEGWIYDPKVGKSYDVAIAHDKKDRLTVTGYKGVKFLSKTFTWTRAPVDLPRCDQLAMEKGPPAVTGQKASPTASRPAPTPQPVQARP